MNKKSPRTEKKEGLNQSRSEINKDSPRIILLNLSEQSNCLNMNYLTEIEKGF